jgi:uncharacterized protein YggE
MESGCIHASLKKNKTMRKIMLTLLAIGMVMASFAQENKDRKPKTIAVTGTAEMEITPDIIYLNITLQEYNKDKNTKVTMATLEDQLKKAVAKAGIPEENLTIDGVDGDQIMKRKKKDPDFQTQKVFRLKVNNLVKLNGIIDGIDDGGLKNVQISEYTHSKMEAYRLAVKVKALQTAKAKAGALLEGIGEKMGGVMEVTEDPVNIVYPMMAQARVMEFSSDAADDTNISFKTIKVTSEIKATFYIQ